MSTVKRDWVVCEIAGSASPLRAAGIRPNRCRLWEIRSHRVYEGSERWCNVPEPRIPCEDDVSGLGIPDANQIDGYVCWHQGESGPRTALQTYADSVRAVTLAVHPLSAADCVPPTVAEIDYLRKRRAVKLKLQEKTPPKFTLSLGSVLSWTRRAVLVLAATWQLKRLHAAPIQASSPIAFGIVVGILTSACCRKWRRDRRRALAGLYTSTDEWVHCLWQLLSHRRKPGHAVTWACLSRGTETCEGINTTLSKLWRFLDPHVSRFILERINLILSNYKPPIFLSLKMDSLKLGVRAPEIVNMHTFSVTAGSIVLHAQVRLVGDDLYGSLTGSVSTGKVKAGVRNMRLSALTRIELMELMQEPPFFKAISISFLEPLEPAFAIKLDTGLLTDTVASSAVKPVLMSILSNEVFSRLFVWPNRLVIPMRCQNHPLIKPILPRIQPHIKGIVAVVVKRGAGLPIPAEHKSVAALSADGLHWYKTGKAYNGPSPVWENASHGGDGKLGRHLLLIPLKELDVGLQVAVGLSDMDSHFKWRDRDNPKIAARTTVNLHSLAEGEVLEGWHKLRPREARAQDGMCLAADERHAWAAPWRKAAQHVSPKRPRRLRAEFDTFQHTFCQAFCEPLPPIPRPRKASSLASYPLPDITKMNGLTGNVLPSSDSDTDDDSTRPTRPPRKFTTKTRWSARPRRSRNRSQITASAAAAKTHTAALQHSAGEGSHAMAEGAERGGSGCGVGRGGAAVIPWGGIYLKLVLLEAKTLKSVFDVSRGAEPHEAAVAMAEVLQPWQAAADADGQLGCLFVTVLEAHGLSLWDESSGFAPPSYTLGLPLSYDTFVKLKLTSGRGATRQVHQEECTGTIEGSRDPQFLRSFEFLAQPASRALEVRVVNTAFVGKGRIQDKVIGEVSLLLSDVAQFPGGKLWRVALDITAPAHPRVVTGRLVLTLDWLPLARAPCPPPPAPRRLTHLGRGSLFVRLICAWDLAPVDVQAMTCNARVCLLAAAQERHSPAHSSMCPVWMTVEQFDDVSECGELWLEVQHVTQFGSQSISRCSINVEDLVPMPNRAVLVTKCLQGWDSGNARLQRTDLHWSARIHPAAADADHPSPTKPPPGPGQGGSRSGRSDIHNVFDACGMHGPDALRWATQHPAEAGGSLASDRAPPDNTASSGWLMFEVAYCPDDDSGAGAAQGRMFSFPRVKREMLVAETRRMHALRQAKLHNALQDTQAPLLAGTLATRKKAVVVGEAGNCLRVEVLRAANMPVTDFTGKSDPYVVLTAQSEAGLQMFRSKTAWATLSPAWNACMDVWEAHSVGGLLEVQVWDDDVLRRDDHIATEHLHVGRTLSARTNAPHPHRGADTDTVLAVAPDTCAARAMAVDEPLPAGAVVSRDVVLELHGARHKRGMPVLYLRLTWVPEGVPAPWGGARAGRPLHPWRHTDLRAMLALVDSAADPTTSSRGDSGSLPRTPSSATRAMTAAIGAAAHAHRGRLSLVVEEVEGGAAASRFPKYVTVRLNRAHVGKTHSQLSCSFQHTLAPMENVSVDDILVFKFKARALRGMLLGQATQAIRELVPDPDSERLDAAFRVPLSGTHLALKIQFTWEPVRSYLSGCSAPHP